MYLILFKLHNFLLQIQIRELEIFVSYFINKKTNEIMLDF